MSTAMRGAGDALLETGVTAYLPTFITAPEEQLLAALREVPADSDGPRILGVHLEGPFLSALRLGVHPAESRRNPDADYLERLLDAGPVRLVTLAPELPGADALIEILMRREIVISCGHSDATSEQANAAFDLGVRTVTHLFNAMHPFHHRDPGVVGAALARTDVVVQLILDGVHIAPTTAEMVWRAAEGRVALVTDAMSGACLTDGVHSPRRDTRRDSGRRRTRPDRRARGKHPHDDRGGHETCTLSAPRWKAPSERRRRCRLECFGSRQQVDSAVGARADVVVLSEELEIERVLVEGRARVVG